MLRNHRPLLLAVLVYVLFRAWIVMTAFDAVAIPVYEVPNMGNQAWLISEGYRGVPWHYFYDNAGCQLLTGVLAAPLYALFGPSYLSLKLVPFLLGIGILGLLWRFLDRNAGRTAAIVGVFAFALAPPTLSKYSLLAKGNHFEGLFFLFLPVVLFFEAQGRERRAPWLIAAGVTAGLAVSLYFGSLLTLALLVPALAVLYGVKPLLRDVRWAAPGFLVGLVPFAWTQWATGGIAGGFARRFTTPNPKADASAMWKEARALVVDVLPGGACFEDLGPLSASIGEWLLIVVFAVSWFVLAGVALRPLWRRAAASSAPPGTTIDGQALAVDRRLRASALLALLYLPLVLGVIAVGVLRITSMPPPVEIGGVRYLVSYYFYGLIGTALAIGALSRSPRALGRATARALTIALTATWFFVLPIGTGHFERAADGMRYPGTFLRNYGGLFQRDAKKSPTTGRYVLDADRVIDVLAQFDRPDDGRARRDILFSLGNSLAYAHLNPEIDKVARTITQRDLDLDELLAPYPAEWGPWLLRGVGANLRVRLPMRGAAPAYVADWLAIAFTDAARREFIAEGLGMSLMYPLRRTYGAELARTGRALQSVPDDLRLALRRGQGIDLGVRLAIGLSGAEARVRATVEGTENPTEREALRGAIEAEAGRAISGR